MCHNASKCFYFIFGFTALNKWKYLSNICHFCCITNSSSCTAPSLTPQNRISAHFGSIQSVAWFPKRMQMCLDSSLMLNLQRIQFIRQQGAGAGCWAIGDEDILDEIKANIKCNISIVQLN